MGRKSGVLGGVAVGLGGDRRGLGLLFLKLFVLCSVFGSGDMAFNHTVVDPIVCTYFVFTVLVLVCGLVGFGSRFGVPRALLLFSVLTSVDVSAVTGCGCGFGDGFVFYVC